RSNRSRGGPGVESRSSASPFHGIRMTSRQPLACGIDFGTSNSAIAIAYRDRVEVVPAESGLAGLTLASVAYLHRDGDRQAGEAAIARYLVSGKERHTCLHCPLVRYGAETDCKQATRNGGCQDTRLVTGVKRDLARTDFTGTHSWARDFELPELVSIVIERLKRSAAELVGGALEPLDHYRDQLRQLEVARPGVGAGEVGAGEVALDSGHQPGVLAAAVPRRLFAVGLGPVTNQRAVEAGVALLAGDQVA